MSICSLDNLHNVSRNVIADFDAGGCFDPPGHKNRLALRKMTRRVFPSLLDEIGFWDHVGEACGRKHGDHIQKEEFGMKMLRKINCHF
jgi:hypothetical protein